MPDPNPQTKICPNCDAEIGVSEKACPNAKCGVDLEELEDTIASVDRAQKILEKRKAAAQPKPCDKCKKIHEGACAPPVKKKSALRSLGAALRKKGA